MSLQLNRHPDGFFYSQHFVDYLRQRQEGEVNHHTDEVLTLDYLRCREGPQAGNAWWQLDWVSRAFLAGHRLCEIGGITLAISPQSLRGLNGRMLHYSGGQVVVKH